MVASQTLFDWAEAEAKKRSVPATARGEKVNDADKERLTGQNGLVLARLEQGPATGPELMRLMGSMNPSARISDVRAWLQRRGKTIKSRRVGDGGWEYRIEVNE